MIGTPVHDNHHLLIISKDEFSKSPEFDFGIKEQECVFLIKKCKTMEEFKQVHGQVLKTGMHLNQFCASNLLATCSLSDWGSMEYACSIFCSMENPGSFEFNTIVMGHVKERNGDQALKVYVEMLEREIKPDDFTYPTLLKACTQLSALEEGTQLHGHILKFGFDLDVFVQNSLINLYGKCREMLNCNTVFEHICRKTTASWSAFISAHVNMGMWKECLQLFAVMNHEGLCRAEESLLVSVLSACTHLSALDHGKCIHGYMLRNISGLNVILETALIDMYAKCGCLDIGLNLFDKMSERNQMSYTVMISGLALHGYGHEAISIFTQMLLEGFDPDDVAFVSVLSACSHAGLAKEGMDFFDKMRHEHRLNPTVQHYGCMVDMLGKAGMLDEALELIKRMDMDPNDAVWRSLLCGCKLHRNIEIGEIAARKLFQLKSRNASDYLTLANMYAKAQRWQDVALVRTRMVQEGIKKEPGSSSVLVNKQLYKFVSQDMSYDGIQEMMHEMEWQLKFEGYIPDTTEISMNVDEEEKRVRSRTHSQKLAIAFGLIHTTKDSCIRIVRNVRMCSDCHVHAKLISMIYERCIIVRDGNRFHHFRDGTCSCRDYW